MEQAINKKENILFLSRRFYPDVGGVEKHVLEIGRRLVNEGNTVTVITESQGGKSEIEGIKIKRIKTPNSWFNKFYVWTYIYKNRTLLVNSDVIHAHDVYFWYFPFRFLYPRKKSFVTFHGYESYPIREKDIWIRKLSEKLSTGNIAVGDFIKKWYGTNPNFVIYGGVNVPDKFREIKNKESALFFGRLDDQTGIIDYAKSVDLIRKKNPKFEFAIFGDGGYKDNLKRYKPTGFKDDINQYISKYEFAFVSRYLSILEALANKRLIFALFDNPVKEDYLKMSPFSKYIVIEKTPEKLAERVEYYLKNQKESQRLIDQGFDWVISQSWETIVDKYKTLWQLSS